jgi:hypothetical protein
MDTRELRIALSTALKASERPQLVALGRAIDSQACWGSLVQSLEELCSDDVDYHALLDKLVALGDGRALLLFLSAARERTAVIEAAAARIAELPRTVQCALVALPEFTPLARELASDVCAAARELADDPGKREAARQVYASHIGALRSMCWGRACGGAHD